jgi:hypothetical protein
VFGQVGEIIAPFFNSASTTGTPPFHEAGQGDGQIALMLQNNAG